MAVLRCAAFAAVVSLAFAVPAFGARLKDIASIEGVRQNQLSGYGLVAGLNGTGDSQQAIFTVQSVLNMLRRRGLTLNINPRQLQIKNVAAVSVTAALPPFARQGGRIDAQVSSLGDAKSLQGGTLLTTPLFGPDGQVYAVAQGPVSLGGGFAAHGPGATAQKSHPTTAFLAGGALVEREVPVALGTEGVLTLALHQPDFTTAGRVATAVNDALGRAAARPLDAGTIAVDLGAASEAEAVATATAIEHVEVMPDTTARVILNERTGTVIIGSDVHIMPIAIAHGSLNVTVKTDFGVSQPAPFSQGQTVVVPDTTLKVEEGAKQNLVLLRAGVSLGELVAGLNALGVTPQDLIAILQAIQTAGALQAELEIM
ncbi:MAG: flagellar basal body P-ring protein FlgI [Deltaproteobacteria bacterium]|nr:MAG: flagellar basal body P-ring protein FlgI [Deltaproteobacteria bacterium]